MIPHFKIETNSVTIEDDQAVNIEVVRPESAVGYAVLSVNDYKSKNYSDVFDNLKLIDISISRDSGSFTKVFSGYISTLRPRLDMSGEVLDVTAWDLARALKDTNCATSYGAESANPTKDTIQEIAQDIITNYVNKSLGSAGTDTYYGLDNTKVENVLSSLSITSLDSPYMSNIKVLDRICEVASAYAQSVTDVGIHWFVDTANNLYMKQINDDSTDASWTRYFGGTQALATLTQGTHFINYDFQKLTEEYANKIVLASAFRKPATDIWTEDGGPTWGTHDCTVTYSTDAFVVGSHGLKIVPDNAPGHVTYAWHPSAHTAAWDFTKLGSPANVPRLNFYIQSNDVIFLSYPICLFTDMLGVGGAGDHYFTTYLSDFYKPVANKWIYISVPIGPYWALDSALQKGDETSQFEWHSVGTPSWSDIDGFCVILEGTTGKTVYLDDLHFSGKIIREAYDASEITSANKEHQKFIRLDTAVDDTLKASDDSGMAGRLAYAELLRCVDVPIVGKLEIPGQETMLPGQTVHIHAGLKGDATYRFDSDMRVTELRHIINMQGYKTSLKLTDDVTNSRAFSYPDSYSLLKEYAGALKQGEANDLKASGVDVLVPRLSKSY